MERYENLGLVGEGSYGMVLKCRHKESAQIVAIKKFIESEDDQMVKKIALREIRMLKLLRHENLVNLLEVFRRKKRVYLVFEFVDKTVLDDLERQPEGLELLEVKRIVFQVLRGLEFCHGHNVIHRDVKPENILVSNSGIVKLCDFGFARTLVTGPGEVFTDYVATRWYRSPELLVGDLSYGKAVDIWAVGCLLFEMLTGDPLFPGDSDIDQLFHITKRLGNLTPRHQEIFQKNPLFTGMRLPHVKQADPFWNKFRQLNSVSVDLIQQALHLDASKRPSCMEMMKHQLFQEGNFAEDFLETLKTIIQKVTVSNPLLRSLAAQKDRSNNANAENKERLKEKKSKSKDHIKKNMSEIKRKKEPTKNIQKQTSHPSLSTHLNTSPNSTHESKKYFTHHNSKKSLSEINNSNKKQYNSESITAVDRETSNFKLKKSKSTQDIEPSLPKYSMSGESERSETKLSLRTPLEVSINVPGKNLPELNCGGNRNHGFDPKKHKNIYNTSNTSKKSLTSNESSRICLLSDKVNAIRLEKSRTDDAIALEKLKRDHESEHPKVPQGLTLPSVKGADGRSTKGSPSKEKDNLPKSYGTTIPHIQNIDPFPSSSIPTFTNSSYREHRDTQSRECKNDSFERTLKSGNLPAVQ